MKWQKLSVGINGTISYGIKMAIDPAWYTLDDFTFIHNKNGVCARYPEIRDNYEVLLEELKKLPIAE